MSTVPALLKYLFIAEFKSGDRYFQNPEDKPVIKTSGSAFSDIADRLNELKAFYLVKAGTDEVVAGVNLLTGQFIIENTVFDAAEQNFIVVNGLKLIFFREARYEWKGKEERKYINRYIIGWETIDRFKKKVQQIIAIS